jgi:hypothetical protein
MSRDNISLTRVVGRVLVSMGWLFTGFAARGYLIEVESLTIREAILISFTVLIAEIYWLGYARQKLNTGSIWSVYVPLMITMCVSFVMYAVFSSLFWDLIGNIGVGLCAVVAGDSFLLSTQQE